MSRAIPSNQQEYKFDQNSHLTGIIVDSNIMPLRDPASTGINGQLCIRGIDPMFLMEGVYGRRFCRGTSNSGSAGLDDNAVRKLRLQLLRNAIAGDKQYWTPTDPTPQWLFLNFGSQRPTETDALTQMTASFQNWNQASANDTYDTLRQDEITHLFQDVKKMNYSWLSQTAGSGWAGFTRSWDSRWEWERERGHMDGTSTETSGVDTIPDGYFWRDAYQLQLERGLGYPDDVKNVYKTTMKTDVHDDPLFFCGITAGWGQRLKCLELRPFLLLECNNTAVWTWTKNGVSDQDGYSETRYIMICTDGGWWDMSLNQYVGGWQIEYDGGRNMAKGIFGTLQENYPIANGWYASAEDIPSPVDPSGCSSFTKQCSSHIMFMRDFYLCHMMYCNLENTPV